MAGWRYHCRPSGAGIVIPICFLGLTPQAMYCRPSGTDKAGRYLYEAERAQLYGSPRKPCPFGVRCLPLCSVYCPANCMERYWAKPNTVPFARRPFLPPYEGGQGGLAKQDGVT